MAYRYDAVRRLEPVTPLADLGRGFAAEVADPAWMLGRQWQLGEHRGEDASSPVRVHYRASLDPIDPLEGNPLLDPRLTPGEAIVESEPAEWWTPGRRVAIGRRVEAAAAATGRPLPGDDSALQLAGLPVPYDLLDGTGYDGHALYERRRALGLEDRWFGELPPPSPRDRWDPAELAYEAEFTCAGVPLPLRRHDGGDLDWFSLDARSRLPTPASPPDAVSVYADAGAVPGFTQPPLVGDRRRPGRHRWVRPRPKPLRHPVARST